MRTTFDLPDDLLQIAKAMARDKRLTLGQAVAELMRRGLQPSAPSRITTNPKTGFPVLHTGRLITTEDVRGLADEEVEYLASFIRPRAPKE